MQSISYTYSLIKVASVSIVISGLVCAFLLALIDNVSCFILVSTIVTVATVLRAYFIREALVLNNEGITFRHLFIGYINIPWDDLISISSNGSPLLKRVAIDIGDSKMNELLTKIPYPLKFYYALHYDFEGGVVIPLYLLDRSENEIIDTILRFGRLK